MLIISLVLNFNLNIPSSCNLMGAQMSALRKDLDGVLPKNKDSLLRSLHVAGHYALIPAIYIYGLVNAGEFSWNPLALLEKVLVA